ncbi:LysR family transcriptional regulator, partial [Pseudomonas sp. FW305-130]
LFIQRRAGHQTSALQGFRSCLTGDDEIIAA